MTRKKPTVPPVTLGRADRDTAVDIIAAPVAGQVYDEERGWIPTDQTAIDLPVVEALELPAPPRTSSGLSLMHDLLDVSRRRAHADAWHEYAFVTLPEIRDAYLEAIRRARKHETDIQQLFDTRAAVARALIAQGAVDG